MIDLLQEEREVNALQSRLTQAQNTLARERQGLATASERVQHAQDAQETLQLLAQAVQQQAHAKISEVVSSCLAAVFDDPYEFKIVFERKRGKTEANLRFTRRGLDIDPLTASGGGAVDVAAFALRVACLVLHRPRLQRVVVMDEPFKFVSAQYQPAIRTMLEDLSARLKLQIIFVTHNVEYQTGKVIEIG